MQESVVIFTPNALEAKQQGIINMTELLCFGRIYALTNKGTKACYCRDKTLASAIGYSLETADKIIGRAVTHLKQLGVIETNTVMNASTKRRERHAKIIADFQLKSIPPSQGGMVDTIPPRQGGMVDTIPPRQGGMVDTIPPRQGGIYTPSAGGNAYPLGKGEFNKTYNRHKTEREAGLPSLDLLKQKISEFKQSQDGVDYVNYDTNKAAVFLRNYLKNHPEKKVHDLGAFVAEAFMSWSGLRKAALIVTQSNKKSVASIQSLSEFRRTANGTNDR